jgi:hypothetical protein
MTKFFTMKRLRVAWKIIRPALGVLTIAAPGSREAKIATVVIGLVAKNTKKSNRIAVRYQQALVAKARLEQLVKMYKKELEAGRQADNKLLAAVDPLEVLKQKGKDAIESGQEV